MQPSNIPQTVPHSDSGH